jgi:formate dehydrogenase (NADP+) beta subunit
MARIIFGAWGDQIIDNRGKRTFEIDEAPHFEEFDEFDHGNGIRVFFGWKGFFVFDREVSLLDAARQYMEKAARESCGKCTPCRVGTRILKEKFDRLIDGQGSAADLDEIAYLAEHVRSTSLCGLGQTATVSLLLMLRHFRDELEKEIASGAARHRQPAATYVTAPCIEDCPAKVEVPKYIDYIKDGKFTHSVGVVLQKYPWAATCGRVCVRFCEFACRRTMVDEAVGIKLLKRFVADREKYVTDSWFSPDLITETKPQDLKVAVIGTGPAGISAAYHLLLKGYPVDVFETLTEPGGMAAVGIPNYRLPKEILRKEVSIIESLGGHIFYNRRLGADYKLNDLFAKGYKAVFLGLGAHKGKTLGVPGENRSLPGYKSGIKFLLYINHYYINMGVQVELGDRTVVVGGGNVAMDCVRSALRMGVKEVHLVYRRTRNEMPADREEIEAAEKEGVIFHFLTHPTRIIASDGKVSGIELIRMELDEPDESGRRGVTPVAGSEFVLPADMVIPAIGQAVDNACISPEDGVAMNKWGLIQADAATLATSHKGVFAGGDCVLGPATLIEAMAQGSRAARSIDDYLTHGKVRFNADDRMSQLLAALKKHDKEELKMPVRLQRRVEVTELDPETRKRIFEEVEMPISDKDAYREAERCMRCYRISMVITEK